MSSNPPNSQYAFILNDNPPSKRVALKGLVSGSRSSLYVFIGCLVILFVAILLLRSGGQTTSLEQALGRGQEVVRVSSLVEQAATDDTTKSLAATTVQSLNGNRVILSGGKGISLKVLNQFHDRTSDGQIQSAAQNNNLASLYASYLKANLGSYKSSLMAAEQSATPKQKIGIKKSMESAQVILGQLK